MNLSQQQQFLANLTSQQRETINHYHDNNMAQLRKICDPIIFLKGVPPMDWDELYDVASDTLLESLRTYDKSKGSQFKTYLSGNIRRAFYDWTRDNRRRKRCNLTKERDQDGNLVKDKNGKQKYVVVSNISIDAPIGGENDSTLADVLPSSFDFEAELAEELGISSDSKFEKYLQKLSRVQREIAKFLSDGYKPSEIRELLHITEKEFTNHMMMIKAYENISILF